MGSLSTATPMVPIFCQCVPFFRWSAPQRADLRQHPFKMAITPLSAGASPPWLAGAHVLALPVSYSRAVVSTWPSLLVPLSRAVPTNLLPSDFIPSGSREHNLGVSQEFTNTLKQPKSCICLGSKRPASMSLCIISLYEWFSWGLPTLFQGGGGRTHRKDRKTPWYSLLEWGRYSPPDGSSTMYLDIIDQ